MNTPTQETANIDKIKRKMVSRLQDAIDDNGRYSYRLKDLSLGYAAAKDISIDQAKTEINAIFKEDMGIGLQDYLEAHRKENGLPIGEDRGR